MTESDVVRDCLQFLRLNGIEAWRQNSGAIPLPGGGFRRFNGRKGQADIIGIVKGRFFACECKMPGKKPTPEQDEFLDMVTRNGGISCWVTSVEELQDDLQAAGVI